MLGSQSFFSHLSQRVAQEAPQCWGSCLGCLQDECAGGRVGATPPPASYMSLSFMRPALLLVWDPEMGMGLPNLDACNFPVKAWSGHGFASGLGASALFLPQRGLLPVVFLL